MVRRSNRPRRFVLPVLASFVAVAMLLSPLAGALPTRAPTGSGIAGAVGPSTSGARGDPLAELDDAPLASVDGGSADEPGADAVTAAAPAGATVPVLLSLSFENSSALTRLLSNLTDPNSSQYHHYVSAAEFTRRFAPNASVYDGLLSYLRSNGAGPLTVYPDRLAVGFSADPTVVGAAFHTRVGRYADGLDTYWAFAGAPELPAPLAQHVAAVEGLGSSSREIARPLAATVAGAGASPSAAAPGLAGYPSPVTLSGVQYLYPSDLQVAYDEESLFDLYGTPTTASVAAILWSGAYGGANRSTACGSLTTGQPVGAYDPGDLSSFFANTTPAGEPVARVVSVSVLGSPAPDCRASYDTTGVEASNTAELEAIGAVAPGASIYAVSSPGPTVGQLDAAFTALLSPPSNLSASVRAGLGNVSVVAVGWGTLDTVDAAWSEDLEQAEARGITVVGATGDSGDNPDSPAWVGSDAEFPASVATGSYGVLAVGGTTVTLDPSTLQVDTSAAWNVSAAYAAGTGALGSAGGISDEYAEPAFQKNSPANAVVDGQGRGVPDVAAVANNTLVTLTVDGARYLATNATDGGPFRSAEGTAVSAGVVTGLLAVVDHTLAAAGNPLLGYVDPTVYAVATEQYTPPGGSGVKVSVTGLYDYGLPTAAFRDVASGRNDVYRAVVGYDLVTGWGALDAYNFTMYVLSVSANDVYGALSGLEDQVKLTDLDVTTRGAGGVVNTNYNATLQQNFFLANPLGAPVYWVQSVVYLHHVGTGWAMNFTAWVAYPFWPIYPHLTVYEYRWPAAGEIESLPLSLTLTTVLAPAQGSTPAELKFTYGLPGTQILTFDVPGAATIVGRTGYSYSWQGTTYSDGPHGASSALGFLAPQLALVGGPPDGAGDFGPSTSGSVTALVERTGSTTFIPAHLGLVSSNNTQTGETASDLGYTISSGGVASFGYVAGSTSQGLYQVEPEWYPATFVQTGLSAGATWYVNLSNGQSLSAPGTASSLSVTLANGSYTFSASTSVRAWAADPAGGAFKIDGAPVTVDLAYGPAAGTVTFVAKGPSKDGHLDFPWYVNITGAPSHEGTATTYQTNLSSGVYDYKISSSTNAYFPSNPKGTFTVSGAPVDEYVTFTLKTYLVEFVFQQPKHAPSVTMSMDGVTESGSFATWGLDEPNGSYGWRLTGLPLGYLAKPSSGTIDVHGPVAPITITITEPGWGPFGLGIVGYAIVFGAAVVAVWLGVLGLRRRARRRKSAGEAGKPTPAVAAAPAPVARAPRPKPPPRAPAPSRDLRPDEL